MNIPLVAKIIFSLTSEEFDKLEWYWQHEDYVKAERLLESAWSRLHAETKKDGRETKAEAGEIREADIQRGG